MMIIRHTDAEVDRVMQETGMDRLTAWRHVNQRHQLAAMARSDLHRRADACRELYAQRNKEIV